MADFASQQRMHPTGAPIAFERTSTRITLWDMNDAIQQTPGHFCGVRQPRPDAELAYRVPAMARDLQRMHADLRHLYHKEVHREWLEKPTPQPQPLIFDRGTRGSREDQFLYPRCVVAHPLEGDLYVVDAGNHRVLELNSAGIVKSVFGSRGSGSEQLNNPMQCTVAYTGRVVVVDRGNHRLQTISFQTGRSSTIPLSGTSDPIAVQVYKNEEMVVAFADGTFREIDNTGREINSFQWSPPTSDRRASPLDPVSLCMAIDGRDRLYVTDRHSERVWVLSRTGRVLGEVPLTLPDSALHCTPTAIALGPLDTLLVADGLNHVVLSYRTGLDDQRTNARILLHDLKMLEEREREPTLAEASFAGVVLQPSDGLGAVQALTSTPEGHLVTTEYSANGRHCLKVFRFLRCKCHTPAPKSKEEEEAEAAAKSSKPQKRAETQNKLSALDAFRKRREAAAKNNTENPSDTTQVLIE